MCVWFKMQVMSIHHHINQCQTNVSLELFDISSGIRVIDMVICLYTQHEFTRRKHQHTLYTKTALIRVVKANQSE